MQIVGLLPYGKKDYQEIKGVKHPFDDREIAGEVLKELSPPPIISNNFSIKRKKYIILITLNSKEVI